MKMKKLPGRSSRTAFLHREKPAGLQAFQHDHLMMMMMRTID